MGVFTLAGGFIISPKAGLHKIGSITIDSDLGEIIAIDEGIIGEYVDAEGYYVFPGFIDLHVHLREPGMTHKETIQSGTLAAVHGGYTTVVCMPNTKPALHSAEMISYVVEAKANCEVLPSGAITMDIAGKTLSPHTQLVSAGAVALSDDGRTTMNESHMLSAFRSSALLSVPIMTHSEDHEITKNFKSKVLPAIAENSIIDRDIRLLKEAGEGHLHISHVSTKEAVESIRKAKAEGLRVTAEATPHHFTLNDEMVDMYNNMSKVNPPIRSEADRQAIVEGLRDGTIDCIATDHAPHDMESKSCSYENATFGISGIETAFSMAFTQLVKKEDFSLRRLVELMSERPAEILNRDDIGVIKVGAKANLAVCSLLRGGIVNTAHFVSKGKNTPFEGMKYRGKVEMTIYKGNIIKLDI